MFLLFFISLLSSLLILIGGLNMLNKPLVDFDRKLVNVQLGGVNHDDYPDYADLYLEYAEYQDNGVALTEEELDYITANIDLTQYLY